MLARIVSWGHKMKWKSICTTFAVLLPCIACATTNVVPSEAQTSVFITNVRRAIDARDPVALRRLCASAVPSPFHQPFFLSYLDRFPTNGLPDGACLVTLEHRQASGGDAAWTPKPIMTLNIEVRTPVSEFGIRHPVGLQGAELKLCDFVEAKVVTPTTGLTVPPKAGASGVQ